MKYSVLLIGLLFLLTGCSFKYEVQKEVTVPLSKNKAIDAKPLDLQWWKHIQSPQLESLIEKALENSSEILISHTQIDQALYALFGADAQRMPTVDASASTRAGSAKRSGGSWESDNRTSANLQVGYELDLWGRAKNRRNLSASALQISEYDHEAIKIALISELVTNYLRWQGVYQQKQIAKEELKLLQKQLQIVKNRYESGVARLTEVQNRQQAILGQKSQIDRLKNQLGQLQNSINLLVASKKPQTIKPLPFKDVQLPQVATYTPSELLLRRPDIAAAKQRVHSSEISVSIQKAARFPSFSLTSSLGYASSSLLAFNNPTTTTASLGLGVQYSIFDGGRIKADTMIAKSQADEALLRYRQSVLEAFKEVEDSIDQVYTLQKQLGYEKESQKLLQSALDIANLEYSYGTLAKSSLIDQRRLLYQNKKDITQRKLEHLLAQVQLYKALGGGWQAQDS